MFRYLFFIGILLIFVAACSPSTPDEAAPANRDSVETAETAQEVEEDHSDTDGDEQGHEDGEHSDEDADAHEHEEEGDEHGHDEDKHSDEDADAHEHEEEGDEHGHDEDKHSDEAADSHEHEEDTHDHKHEDDEHGDDERREHGAHEHGAAQLMVAWSGSDMAIDLETPSYNLLGFEYVPTSDGEKNLLTESVAALEEGGLLQLNSDAECAVVSANVQSALLQEEDHADDHDEEAHEAEEAETHSDFDVSYNLECQQSDNIESLDASQLFEQFPNFEAIQVQWISDTQQSAANLTPDNPVLSLK